ncbi:MAG: 4-hydroxy-tetrahydrodipicolinate synthase, partial [Pseudomonadota bacterium]|nr:4-hydroxy-tetrahydrodipicolinate synthase [Pseudomonadota bacterium]
MLKGSLVAIVTPMFEDGSLDLDNLRSLVDFHIASGTDGIVVVGTTGESPTVDYDEHCLLIEAVSQHAAGRIPVIAGTGANSTAEAIELTRYAAKQGVHSCLLVTPYYNRPTQEGLYRHYRAVAEAVDVPQILYNVPSRTAVDLANDTVVRLSEISNIIGVKDATGSMERCTDLLSRVPKDFAVYGGDDSSGLAVMLMGGHGVISVTANVAPALMHQMCEQAFSGNVVNAVSINGRLIGLHQKLFVEANPIPVKWALKEMGLIREGIRLPLTL